MHKLKEMIQEADMLLIGIGDEFTEKKASKEDILHAYQKLGELISGKPWFLISCNTDDLVYESGLSDFFIVTPCGSERTGNIVTNPDFDQTPYIQQWQFYTNYLTSTLGKKLLIIELGVGLSYPGLIRMPFEKTIQVNNKSRLFRVHSKLAFVPDDISERCVTVTSLPVAFLLNNKK